MCEETKRTGVEPSPLRIITSVNKKRNLETKEKTGEVTHPKLVASVERYCELYKERFDDESDPLDTPLRTDLWTSIDEVRSGLSNGRILVIGSSSRASQMMDDDPPPSQSTTANEETAHDLQKKVAELEKTLEAMVKQEVEIATKGLMGQIARLAGQLQIQSTGTPKACTPPLVAPPAVPVDRGIPSLAASPPRLD